MRLTTTGKTVCNFTVAVNRRRSAQGQPEADFFRVAAWNQAGENCGKYLVKGRKVAVIGSVSANAYKKQNGEPGASLEVLADDVEFLSSGEKQTETKVDPQTGYQQVDMGGELPY